MALTKIRGNTQIKLGSITNVEIAANAGIELSKLAEGAELIKRDGSVAFTGSVNLDGNKLLNVAAPTSSTDGANMGYVDAEVAVVQAEVDAEELARAAADTQLQANIDAEALARANADTTLQGNIDSEAAARAAGDLALQGNIDSEAATRSADDITLQAHIDAEAAAREAADSDLSDRASDLEGRATDLEGRMDSAESDIDSLESRASTLEDGLQAETQARIADVDAEEARAMVAEAALASDLSDEEARAMAAEAVLQSNIDAEESARQAADTNLQSNINTEINDRSNADANLQAQIDVLESDFTADISALETRMDTAEGDIDSLESRMDAAEGDIDSLESGLAQEILDRQAGDAATLASAQSYADQKISDLVDGAPQLLDTLNELAAAIGDDANFAVTLTNSVAAVQAEVDAEEARAMAAEAALAADFAADLNAEAAARAAADVTLQSNIDAEAVIRAAADSALNVRVTAIEAYDKETVYVDNVNGLDQPGRGTLVMPFKSINYAYSQVPVVTGATDLEKVTKFVTEKIIFDLAPGTYTENVQIGFKRARMAIVGNGVRIVGNVKCKVLKADLPVASLESYKAQLPAPFTGTSAQMCFEISGEAGGGLEGDSTAMIVTVTGLTSLDFENGGANYNWDTNHGQFYSYFDNVNLIGGFNMIHDNTVATARAPAVVVELESAKVGNGDSATRSYFGFVPYGAATTVPAYGGLTLKAHNSTIASVLGPTLTIGEVDGCRIYDIDRTMGAVVTNGSVSGSTSTSYVGIVNTQFRAFSGAAGSSVYKMGATGSNVSYKIDAVSHGTLTVGRTLDVAAGRTVTYTLLDRAASVLVVPTGNISSVTVQAALEELQGDVDSINTSLATKASISALNQEISDRIAGDNTLQSNINAEAATRLANDNTLQNNINSEAATRAAGDANLQSQINTLSASFNADLSALDARMDTAESDINALEGRADSSESRLDDLESQTVYIADVVTRETPAGDVNGVNDEFILAHDLVYGSEQIFLNGLLQEPGVGNDYTIIDSTITMNSAPLTNDRIRVTYLKVKGS